MSIRVMADIYGCRVGNLAYKDGVVTAPTVKNVLLALADHADDWGEGCYPSLTLLMLKTELSRPSIINALAALVEGKWISYKGVSSRGTSNYTINLSMVKEYAYKRPGKPGKPALLPGNVTIPPSNVTLPEPSFNHTQPPKDITPQQAMFQALSDVTGMDGKIQRNAGRLGKAASELIKAGYSAEGVYYWRKTTWAADFKSKNGAQKPTLNQVLESIGAAKPAPKVQAEDPDIAADKELIRMSPRSPRAAAARARLQAKGVAV